MLKYLVAALTAFLFVVLSSGSPSPANATADDSQVYIWDYATISGNQVSCKQITFHPVSRPLSKGIDVQPTHISSHVVEDGYCKNIRKPQI
ncbi:MAG: hypothetical protein SWJ54_14470 [Cyanobacteriota bacterium]|nr:hypothetical protein [Cyanobacteriota bacterium]